MLVKTFMANSWTMNIKEKVKAEVKVKNFLNLNLIFYQVIKIVYTQRYKKPNTECQNTADQGATKARIEAYFYHTPQRRTEEQRRYAKL